MAIAWDVDDCLIIPSVATGLPLDTPNYENIVAYKWFKAQGHYMVVWSGSGLDYAARWAEKLGLQPDAVWIKEKNEMVDLAFDDCIVDLGKVNIRVKRIENSISRKEWNKEDLLTKEEDACFKNPD